MKKILFKAKGRERLGFCLMICFQGMECPIIIYSFINYPQVLEFSLSQFNLTGENAAQHSATVAIHILPISVPSGTLYCWVDIGIVDSKLAQVFYT